MSQKINSRAVSLILVLMLILAACFSVTATADEARHQPITEQLITMVDHNASLRSMLEESIALAKKINPDPVTNPAQTLEDYYLYVDWASLAMPWNILSNLPYTKLYEQLDQSIDYLYFICDQPLKALEGKGYYNNSIQYVEPYRT